MLESTSRYSRQVLFSEIGKAGQQQLLESKVVALSGRFRLNLSVAPELGRSESLIAILSKKATCNGKRYFAKKMRKVAYRRPSQPKSGWLRSIPTLQLSLWLLMSILRISNGWSTGWIASLMQLTISKPVF
jgi:hypothetical protein